MSKIDWTDLAGPLASTGGSLLGLLVGGPAGAALGARIGALVGEALGVPATPDAVRDALALDPARSQAALGEIERTHGAELIALARGQLAFQELIVQHEKAEGWTSYGWRRLAGWSIPVLGLWQLLLGPLAAALAGTPLTADFSAFLAYAGIVATYLMGGHTVKEVFAARR